MLLQREEDRFCTLETKIFNSNVVDVIDLDSPRPYLNSSFYQSCLSLSECQFSHLQNRDNYIDLR